jgi:translation elongation factor EF-4
MEREDMTIDEYAGYLAFGDENGESPIPGEFIHDTDGVVWFMSGGSQCVGSAFCEWHSGVDAVYAVGSSTIANVGINCDTLRDAIGILEQIDMFDSDYDRVERDWLVELGRAALNAQPSESVQSVHGDN